MHESYASGLKISNSRIKDNFSHLTHLTYSDVWDLVESSRSGKRKDGSPVIKNIEKPIYDFSISKVMIVSTHMRAYSIFLALA